MPGDSSFDASGCRVLGLGSWHGDDVAGWWVIDALAGRLRPAVGLRKLSTPLQVLDECGGVDSLHLVDAYDDSTGRLPVSRLDVISIAPESSDLQLVPADRNAVDCGHSQLGSLTSIPKHSSRSTHSADLMDALRLAQRLRRLPPKVVVWVVAGSQFFPGGEIGPACRRAAEACAVRIAEELNGA